MIKLAVNLSMIFTEVPLLERFALARAHGFDHIEIQFPYELSIEQIQTQLTIHDLSLCLINAPAGDLMTGGNGLAGIPGQEIEFHHGLEKAILYAKALQVPSINILAGKQPLDADLLPCLKTLATNLKLACHMCSDHGIQPVFEMINGTDMPRFLVQNIAQAQEMLEAVRHPALKMQFDCYHMAMMGENLLESLQENIDAIGHIQFADNPGRHEPDTGNIDYAVIFDWLKHSQYTGFSAAEYRPQNLSQNSFAWKDKYFSSIN
ncbi:MULTISPECIES: hydroxypyruvate isomerase family protein [Acinetobacter]|mgnify:CR=1 FL=1|uniref:hydroxypyruvate isomerase family protein n=1 Tax=Acinetobacter TaxID=469 RepID=UPI000E34B9C1|nr:MULTISPECIES: TIM barrel protein [Acinetobacter]RFS31717.1 hydroxypyruvate isomerase [Acinetobacter sp. SWAC5]RKG45579.1 hydroxypyruvate isomerase [Acinetobacter cumulans]RKG49412.1 hydroxypyruvate isomerase [Acinetobacter cumulans]RZG60584.1 hydroxypyruvate isomerase [Acinetobacter sp. WCHAc060006]